MESAVDGLINSALQRIPGQGMPYGQSPLMQHAHAPPGVSPIALSPSLLSPSPYQPSINQSPYLRGALLPTPGLTPRPLTPPIQLHAPPSRSAHGSPLYSHQSPYATHGGAGGGVQSRGLAFVPRADGQGGGRQPPSTPSAQGLIPLPKF